MKFISKSRIIFIVLMVLVVAGYFYSQSRSTVMIRIQGATMGTQYLVLVAERPGKEYSKAGLKAGIEELLALINQQMSTYIADSQISLFNNHKSQQAFPVFKEFFEVAQLAKLVAENTGNAFDPTVSPLVDLWGFGPKARPTKIPSDQQIKSALAATGMDKLTLQSKGDHFALIKDIPELQLDFSAIAKGYAVDLLSRYLTKIGHNNHMVEIGGEIRVSGLKGPDQEWTVGIEKPEANTRTGLAKLTITNSSIATSGSYRNYYELDGKRFSHTIDPRTGRPIEHNMISVSVIAGSCGLADAYATAFMVMGPEETLKFANKNDLFVYLLLKEGDKIEVQTSKAFAEAYQPEVL